MYYLKKFETDADYLTYINGEDVLLPNVSYCANEVHVHYNPFVERLVVKYNVEDASQPTQLYFYYVGQQEGEPSALGINLFDKVEIDGTEVSVTDLDAASGTTTQLSVGEHTVAYTLKDPTFIGLEFDEQTRMPTKVGATFMRCNAITSVTIPNSVTSIGTSAFAECSGLTSVTIGDSVESIGDNAFRDCSGLASVTIGDSVESIGINAFYGCGNLTSIEMPDGVTSIGNTVFYECSSLMSAVIYATTPPTLGNSVFYGNASGRKIYVPSSSVNTYKAASGWSAYASSIQAIQ